MDLVGDNPEVTKVISKIQKIKSEDRVFNLFQDSLVPSVNELVACEILDYVILKNVSLNVGDNTIPHKLNRELLGWHIVRQRTAGALIFDKQDSNSAKDKNLILNSSANCNVDIYVF